MSTFLQITLQDYIDKVTAVTHPDDSNFNRLFYDGVLILSNYPRYNDFPLLVQGSYDYILSLYGRSYHIVVFNQSDTAGVISKDFDTFSFFLNIEIDSLPVPNAPYSQDCPYLYKLYNDSNYSARLSILKNSTVVLDEGLHSYSGRVDINSSEAIYYAETKLKEYVDKCKANLKIKTTCCLLVCCEPNKYQLI